MKKFLSELRRRKVVKTLVAYVGLSWLLLQVVGVITSMIEVSPLVGPATLLILACCLPVAIYLSWHFDISLEGIERTPSLDEEDTSNIKPLGWLRWTGLVFVFFVSGLIGYQYFDSIRAEQQASKEGLSTVKLADSIAVLPFTDQSPEKDQSYLALGISEEITSLLGRSEGFKVSASRSSQILTEKGLTPIDIGRRLNVKTVLTGSVRATGNRLKIRVELLDTETGHTLWTENFLRELKDIFEVESEIGRAIVNLLQDRYLEAGSFESFSSTKSTDAYVMYLKGRELYREQTTESLKQARKLFEQAVALDPEYAKGYVGIADTLVLLADHETGFGILETDIAATLGKQNIDKALVRQPMMAEAYAVKGYISFILNDFDNAISEFNKAIELNPSLASAHMWKFLALNSLQRFEESLLALQKSQELDPLFQTGSYNLGVALTRSGRVEEAKIIFEQLKKDFPDSTFSHQGLADIYFSQGSIVGALRETQKAVKLSPDNQHFVYSLVAQMLQLGLSDSINKQKDLPAWKEAIDYYYANLLILEEDFDTLFKHMDFQLAANPDDYWLNFEAGWYHAMYGDKNKSYLLLTEKKNLIDDADTFFMPLCSPAIEIAWAEQALGNTEIAQTMIKKCEGLMNLQRKSSISYFELDYLAARIYSLKGQTEPALQALTEATNNGWREWWTKHDPLLNGLSNEPKFNELLQLIDDDLSKQKAEALSLFDE